jgi:ankyrin repeat protein
MAVWNNRMEIVRLLISCGCDMNIKECYGDTPLLLCARRGYAPIMSELLKAGADTLAKSDESDTPLHYACRYGHSDCVRILVAAMPHLETKNMWHITAVFYALMYGYSDAAKVVLEAGGDAHALDRHDKSLLHYATMKNLSECVKTILNRGVSPDCICMEQKTPLGHCVQNNFLESAVLLVQANCNLNLPCRLSIHRTLANYHPLEIAVRLGHGSMTRLLVQAGSNMEPLRTLWIAGEVSEKLLQDDSFLVWMDNTLKTPRSLAGLCRLAITQCLGHKIKSKVQLLPLPPTVKDFLLFNDVNCFP